MTIFLESPWPILFIGISVEAVLALLLLQTGRGKLLTAMIAVAIFTAAGLIVEHLVITDRKAVVNTLYDAVTAVKANDRNRMLDCISPSVKWPRNTACWLLDRVEVEEAYLSGLEVTINRLTNPPTAEARFLAIGRAKDKSGQVPYQGYSQHVVVRLRLEGNRWLVADYDIEGLPK